MSFVNEYAWGDFKGKNDLWMERNFDAFLNLANWGTHIMKLRLPPRLLNPTTALAYFGNDSASVNLKSGKLILSFPLATRTTRGAESGSRAKANFRR